jgi:hypothetical protein
LHDESSFLSMNYYMFLLPASLSFFFFKNHSVWGGGIGGRW